MSLLKVKKLNKSYGRLHILKSISFEVEAGERHVIIGPNGAGKTTLFNCITGTVKIDSGEIIVENTVTNTLPNHRLAHLGVSRTFQHNNLFEDLTVEENVRLAILSNKRHRLQMLRPLESYKSLRKETDDILREWNMTENKQRLVKELSYGEKRVLEVILSMASEPRLLLLDEPTSGMSPSETKSTAMLIKNLPRSVTLLMIEHDMEVVFSIADKITVLHHGELIMSGTPEEIRENELIREIYFGGGAVANA